MKTILTTLLLFGMAGAHGELFKATGYQKYYTHVTSSAVGDVNNDGFNDVVLVREYGNEVAIYLNDQSNGFQVQTVHVTRVINQIDLADLNGDGRLDLWVLSSEGSASQVIGLPANVSAHLEVFLNDGDSGFVMTEPFMRFVNNALGQAFRVHDFDQDGHLDVLLTTQSASYPPGSSNWSIYYRGQADGGFEPSNSGVHVQRGSKLADFNQDGFMDLWNLSELPRIYLFDEEHGFSPDHVHRVYFDVDDNNPPNTLGVFITSFSRVALGDLDGDGDVDIQAFGYNGEFWRFLNTDGQFVSSLPELELPLPFTPLSDSHSSRQIGGLMDLNNDGLLDLIMGSYESDHIIKVSGVGSETAVDVLSSDHSNRLGNDMLIADFTADSHQDALVIGANGLQLWVNDSHGQLNRHTSQDEQWGIPTVIQSGMMDGDDHVDLVIGGRDGIVLRSGNGAGAFGPNQTITRHAVEHVAVFDANQDGLNDLAGLYQNKVMLWEAQPNGAYLEKTLWTLDEGMNHRLQIHDFDRDGRLDISFINQGQLIIMINHEDRFGLFRPFDHQVMDYVWGAGQSHQSELLVFTEQLPDQFEAGFQVITFDIHTGLVIQQEIAISALGITNLSHTSQLGDMVMRWLDVNMDGVDDVIAPFLYAEDQALIWLEKVDDTWQGRQLAAGAFNGVRISQAYADLNQDGFLDAYGSFFSLLSPSYGYLALGSANGFEEPEPLTTGFGSYANHLVDVDADGDLDLIELGRDISIVTQLNTRIDVDFSGLWYSPEQDGHGLSLEQIDIDGTPHVFFSWFVFHQNKPFWLTGLGEVEGNQTEILVGFSSGTGFGDDFDADAVEHTFWGTVHLNLTDPNHIDISWDTRRSGFEPGQMSMQRLTSIKPATARPQGIRSCHSGSWYNADQSGHGLFVQVIESNGEDQLLVAWYHHLAGEPYWMIGLGPIRGSQAWVTLEGSVSNQFPPQFETSDHSTQPWGSLHFDLISYDRAKIRWHSLLPEFPDGELDLQKLTLLDRYHCP